MSRPEDGRPQAHETGTSVPVRSPAFDSFTLRAVTHELREALVGGQVQRVRQPDQWTIILHVHNWGKTHRLLLSAHPELFRAHLTTQPFENPKEPPTFCMALRKYLEGGRVTAVSQDGADRVLRIDVSASLGGFQLVAELMGRHSNVILLDGRGRIIEAIKHVGPSISHRVVLPGRPYQALSPPDKPSLWDAPNDDLEFAWRSRPDPLTASWLLDTFAGMSPRLADKIIDSPDAWTAIQAIITESGQADRRPSETLDAAYSARATTSRADQLRAEAKAILDREAKTIQRRLDDLGSVERSAGRAAEWRIAGELLSANAHAIPNGETRVSLPNFYDADLAPLEIMLDAKLSARENAEAYFTKARKAKAAADRVPAARNEWEGKLAGVDEKRATVLEVDEKTLETLLEQWRGPAREQRHSKTAEPEYPPGVRIRKYTSDDGWHIWIGDNATGNDYLTTKLADPDDIWLHVRAAASAHGVIRTGRKPDAVPPATLKRAAELVAAKSEVKNSGSIPVDYVLKRYVRKPRGAAPGRVTYSREKTIYVG